MNRLHIYVENFMGNQGQFEKPPHLCGEKSGRITFSVSRIAFNAWLATAGIENESG
jgi:hypothetical protein